MTGLEHDILKSIQGHTRDRPQDLAGILAYVDARQKTVLTREELESGLRQLIQEGRIAEAAPLHYFELDAPPPERPFSGVTAEDHRRACEAYLAWFWGTAGEPEEPAEDEFSQRKIVVRWSMAGNRFPTEEDADAAEALMQQLDPLLESSALGEIIGYERGAGCIDILIFGRDTDDDVDEIYALIAPAFRAFGCPPGSCIVRCYQERDEEVVSDVVGEGGPADHRDWAARQGPGSSTG